jgi:hypothetical protein
MQSTEAHLFEAIEAVSAWDLPEEDFADAVNAQARLLCGVPSDDYWRSDLDVTVQ